MTDNIITARLFIDMDGTLAAWQQAACFEDLLQENYFRDLPPYQTVVDAVRILCNAHPELATIHNNTFSKTSILLATLWIFGAEKMTVNMSLTT